MLQEPVFFGIGEIIGDFEIRHSAKFLIFYVVQYGDIIFCEIFCFYMRSRSKEHAATTALVKNYTEHT